MPALDTVMGQEGSCDAHLPRESLARVCTVVVTYQIGPRTRDCVDSIMDQVGEIVIVDNGSDGRTLEALRLLETRPTVRIIYNNANFGIARALNQGVQWAIQRGHRWVLTLDHDSEATPGMVEKLLGAFVPGDSQLALLQPIPSTGTRVPFNGTMCVRTPLSAFRTGP